MTSHAPAGYICPFCGLVRGIEDQHVLSTSSDIVYRDDTLTAFISSGQWPRNQGHVLIIPNAHFENLYDLPDSYGEPILRLTRRLALAMKAEYGCTGVSTRQHNEPDGNQDVWHYHVHLFPRYRDDGLYVSAREFMLPERRAEFASRLRARLES